MLWNATAQVLGRQGPQIGCSKFISRCRRRVVGTYVEVRYQSFPSMQRLEGRPQDRIPPGVPISHEVGMEQWERR